MPPKPVLKASKWGMNQPIRSCESQSGGACVSLLPLKGARADFPPQSGDFPPQPSASSKGRWILSSGCNL